MARIGLLPRPRTLVAINAALAAGLAVSILAGPSNAQNGGGRARGQYTMVGGAIQGGNSNAIYVVDASNQEMIAVRWDESRKDISAIGYRDLAADAKLADPGR